MLAFDPPWPPPQPASPPLDLTKLDQSELSRDAKLVANPIPTIEAYMEARRRPAQEGGAAQMEREAAAARAAQETHALAIVHGVMPNEESRAALEKDEA